MKLEIDPENPDDIKRTCGIKDDYLKRKQPSTELEKNENVKRQHVNVDITKEVRSCRRGT